MPLRLNGDFVPPSKEIVIRELDETHPKSGATKFEMIISPEESYTYWQFVDEDDCDRLLQASRVLKRNRTKKGIYTNRTCHIRKAARKRVREAKRKMWEEMWEEKQQEKLKNKETE